MENNLFNLNIKKEEILNDSSAITLIFSNLFTIVMAIVFNWSLLLLLWIYWWQSIIIGIFNFLKILSLKNFSTDDFKINKKPIKATITKTYNAIFFALHYGIFHAGYAGFIFGFNVFGVLTDTDIFAVLNVFITITLLFLNHMYSFIHNRKELENKNIKEVMFAPYYRIIPMHLTILFGFPLAIFFSGKITIIFFLVLKMLADVVMHVKEHKPK